MVWMESFQLIAMHLDGTDVYPSETDDASADERRASSTTEDDELHDDLHGSNVLPSSFRSMPLLHRNERLVDDGALAV